MVPACKLADLEDGQEAPGAGKPVVAAEAVLEVLAGAWAAEDKTVDWVCNCTWAREVAAADTAGEVRGSSLVCGRGFESWDERDSEGAAGTHVAGGTARHSAQEVTQKAWYV